MPEEEQSEPCEEAYEGKAFRINSLWNPEGIFTNSSHIDHLSQQSHDLHSK